MSEEPFLQETHDWRLWLPASAELFKPLQVGYERITDGLWYCTRCRATERFTHTDGAPRP